MIKKIVREPHSKNLWKSLRTTALDTSNGVLLGLHPKNFNFLVSLKNIFKTESNLSPSFITLFA